MHLANGKYIVRMDSDDIMLPHRLQRQYDYMESHKEISVCGSWIKTFGTDNSIYKLKTENRDIICEMLIGNPLCHPSVIIRMDILNAVFYNNNKDVYNQSYIYAEDYKLWYDIITNGGIISSIDEVLLLYRCSDTQMSYLKGEISCRNALKIRMAYLKDICRVMVTEHSSYLQIFQNLFSLFKQNKLNFDLFCDIIRLIYMDYLTRVY